MELSHGIRRRPCERLLVTERGSPGRSSKQPPGVETPLQVCAEQKPLGVLMYWPINLCCLRFPSRCLTPRLFLFNEICCFGRAVVPPATVAMSGAASYSVPKRSSNTSADTHGSNVGQLIPHPTHKCYKYTRIQTHSLLRQSKARSG